MSMIKHVPFPKITTPILYDKVVQKVRDYLDTNLTFVAWSFHIAKVGETEDGQTYPQIYAQDGSIKHYDLRPDWSEPAFFFFEIDDPTMNISDEGDGTEYNMSLVFYGRLDKIDPGKIYDYTANIISEFLLHLTSPTIQARGITVDTNPDTIWSRYSAISQSFDQSFMKYGTTFRINFMMRDQDCYEELI